MSTDINSQQPLSTDMGLYDIYRVLRSLYRVSINSYPNGGAVMCVVNNSDNLIIADVRGQSWDEAIQKAYESCMSHELRQIIDASKKVAFAENNKKKLIEAAKSSAWKEAVDEDQPAPENWS